MPKARGFIVNQHFQPSDQDEAPQAAKPAHTPFQLPLPHSKEGPIDFGANQSTRVKEGMTQDK